MRTSETFERWLWFRKSFLSRENQHYDAENCSSMAKSSFASLRKPCLFNFGKLCLYVSHAKSVAHEGLLIVEEYMRRGAFIIYFWSYPADCCVCQVCLHCVFGYVYLIMNIYTVNSLLANTSRRRPPPASDHFVNNRPAVKYDRDHSLGQKFDIFFCFLFPVSEQPRELLEINYSDVKNAKFSFSDFSLFVIECFIR